MDNRQGMVKAVEGLLSCERQEEIDSSQSGSGSLMEEVSVELHFQTQVDFQKEPVGKVEEF